MLVIEELIRTQIILLRSYITRMQGIGIYQDHCQRWALYIEAYEILLTLIREMQLSLTQRDETVSIDNRVNHDTQGHSPVEESVMDIAPSVPKLHPHLRRCLHDGVMGPVLQHPLIVQSYLKRYNAIYNRQYRDKLEAVKQARASRNWSKFIWLHERPFRAEALQQAAGSMHDDQFWRTLAEVWTDAENIFQMRAIWLRLWAAERSHRAQVMTDDEHDALAILPESTPGIITIYRGCRNAEAVRGLSWAVSRTQALWFAHRYANPEHMPLLVTATVRKRDIQAYFHRRGDEVEVVVLPDDICTLVTEPLALRQRKRVAA